MLRQILLINQQYTKLRLLSNTSGRPIAESPVKQPKRLMDNRLVDNFIVAGENVY